MPQLCDEDPPIVSPPASLTVYEDTPVYLYSCRNLPLIRSIGFAPPTVYREYIPPTA